MAHRHGLATVVALVLLASCAQSRPDVGLTISGTTVLASREGNCEDTGCSGGACPPPVAPLTVVRATTPVRLDFVVGSEVDQISGAIWRGETMMEKAIETFTIVGGARSYTTAKLEPGGRYYIIATIQWSRFTDRGLSYRAFLVEIASP